MKGTSRLGVVGLGTAWLLVGWLLCLPCSRSCAACHVQLAHSTMASMAERRLPASPPASLQELMQHKLVFIETQDVVGDGSVWEG